MMLYQATPGADVRLLSGPDAGALATVWARKRVSVEVILEGKRLGRARLLPPETRCEPLGTYSPNVPGKVATYRRRRADRLVGRAA